MESSDARLANRAAVLNELLSRGTGTRVAIAAWTGLSKATVSRVTDDLIQEGLIRETGPLPGTGPGRQALALALAGEETLVCGVDLGGSNTRFLVTDIAGRVHARAREATPRASTAAETAHWLAARVAALAGSRDLGVTAVGLPGAVHPRTGAVRTAPNLPQLEGTAFTEAVAAALPGRTVFDNDANAALLGEVTAGAARGYETAAMVTIGTGLGASVHLGGRLLTGRTGAVGEFGVLPYGDGTLESFISGSGMVARARRMGSDVRDAAQIFEQEEPRTVLDDAAVALMTLVTALNVAYEPEVVVLGGGVASPLIPRLRGLAGVLEELTPQPPKIVLSALGDPAGAVGSLMAALHTHYRALDVHMPDLRGVAATLLRSLPSEDVHVPAPSA